MSTDDTHPGVPTRAIHEAYLDMQRALKKYRRARDQGDSAEVDRAHGEVQEAVLTLFELLRPHIIQVDAIEGYWDGELPQYNGDGSPPDPEDGEGVLQVQTRTQTFDWSQVGIESADELEQLDGLDDWHDALQLNGKYRIQAVAPQDEGVFVQLQRYQLGLRHLDEWTTEHRTTQTQIGGFLGTATKETAERSRVDFPRLRRAARELSKVANRLGALSDFEPRGKRTEITREDIEDVREWQQQNLQ